MNRVFAFLIGACLLGGYIIARDSEAKEKALGFALMGGGITLGINMVFENT